MRVEFSPPDISELEIAGVVNTLRSGWIVTGPKTKLFENKIAAYCGVPRVACLSSATAALELALRVLGVGPGDEVITSAYTYTASAAVIQHVGAKIVLVDTAPGSYEMDPARLEEAITERTKVVIPVDVGGVASEYRWIFDAVAKKKALFSPGDNVYQRLFNRVIVLADAAHSFGARYEGKVSGNLADFSCFSFHAVKSLTTAEGGAITWQSYPGLDHEALYREIMLLSLHGQTKDAFVKMRGGSWEYDIETLGYKCNMTDIQAALGLSQLARFEEMMMRRKKMAKAYDALLPTQIERLEHFDGRRPGNAHLYMVRIPGVEESRRNEIIQAMAREDIAVNVHFKPLPLFTAYKRLGFDIAMFPNAFAQYQNEMTLPLHSQLQERQVQYVARTLRKIISK